MKLRLPIALAIASCALSACNLFSEAPATGHGGPDVGTIPDAAPRDTGFAVDGGNMPDSTDSSDVSSDAQPTTDIVMIPDQKPSVDLGMTDLGDLADVCVPETEAELCTQVTAECGTAAVVDSCGTMRAPTCGSCPLDEVCQNNVCECVPDSNAELCTAAGATCGQIAVTDNCGVMRMADCGACTMPQTCSQNTCVCVPEADAEFCARLAANCDVVTAPDNCGAMRSVDCGVCTPPATCGGGGTPNVCACAAQSDAAFCADNNASCGTVTGIDDCGASRTVNCGACTAPETCGGGGVQGACGCTPESDAELCMAAGAQCGTVAATDACGAARTVDCGGCMAGACQSNLCGVVFTSTVGAALRHNAAPVVDTITVTGCATIASVTIDVDITHTFRGDIRLDLVSPTGTARRLKTESFAESSADLIGNYPLTLTPVESLDVLVGEVGAGDWTITAQDMYQQDQGTFNSWGVRLECN